MLEYSERRMSKKTAKQAASLEKREQEGRSGIIWEAVFNNSKCTMLYITHIINCLISLSDISSEPGPFSILIEVTCSPGTFLTPISFLFNHGAGILWTFHGTKTCLPWSPQISLLSSLSISIFTLDTPVNYEAQKRSVFTTGTSDTAKPILNLKDLFLLLP